MSNMFCFQCEETLQQKGCTTSGVCGKSAEVANLQDALLQASKYAAKNANHEMQIQIMRNLFMTITNANFSKNDILDAIKATDCDLNVEQLMKEGSLQGLNEDIRSLESLVLYGLKGMSAYLYHAYELGYEDASIFEYLCEALHALLTPKTLEEYLAMVDTLGAKGVDAMALLDNANTSSYGNPEISEVSIEAGDRPGILVSGHDLHDLETLLIQSEDSGIDIYTHSEMLPAHYYPAFKKFKHFKGNYGNAWWQQQEEFESFHGPILMTTNCLVPVKESYRNRIFTTGVVGFDGIQHIKKVDNKKDFQAIIELAKTCEAPKNIEHGTIIGGFAHHQVFALSDKIVEAIKSKKIKRFIVMAGCDGRHKKREYYTEFAKQLPKDTVILTAGCAKYRYLKLNLGDIDGIPRVLDAGQCNDSYSLALIALKLKEIFQLADINDLPITYNIAWYEQKAVIVLLALLKLGVKDIHVGPHLPAFLSPTVLKHLVDTYGLSPIGSVEEDLEKFNLSSPYETMTMDQILKLKDGMEDVLYKVGFYCLGCPSSQFESLKDACELHDLNLENVVNKIKEFVHE